MAPKLPRFVAVRKLNILVPPLPQNDLLLQTFHNYLTKTTEPADNYHRLDWLRVMALYLYFNQERDQVFLSEMRKILEDWKQMPTAGPLRTEIGYIEQWLMLKYE